MKIINNFSKINKTNDGIIYQINLNKSDDIICICNDMLISSEYLKIYTDNDINVNFLLNISENNDVINEQKLISDFEMLATKNVNTMLNKYGIILQQKQKYVSIYFNKIQEDFVLNILIKYK